MRDRSIGKVAGAAILPREKESEGGTLMFQFESTAPGTSVFNRESLTLMKEIEVLVLSVPGYTDVCQLKYDGEGENATSAGCVESISPLNFFFPTVTVHANGTVQVTPDGNGPLVDDIDAVVRAFDADRRSARILSRRRVRSIDFVQPNDSDEIPGRVAAQGLRR